MLRRPRVTLALLIALAVAVHGCGAKNDNSTADGSASSDSLLSASPIESTQAGLQPATDFQPQADQPPAPAHSGGGTSTPSKPARRPSGGTTPAPAPGVTVAAGTGIKISVGTALTSETAQPGDSWSGTVGETVVIGSAAPFPAGSVVHGVVDGVKPAAKGDRAVLVLRVTSIEANGHTHAIGATADSIVAGSTRTRNVGAVAGGAAAGALLGKAIGGSGKGALIGGILGGATATGVVATSKGYQATVKEGAELVFHVDHDTKINL